MRVKYTIRLDKRQTAGYVRNVCNGSFPRMNNASIMSSRTRSGYYDLFSAPALGSGREGDENGTEFRKIKKPHPATYNPGGPLSSKTREVVERASKFRWVAGGVSQHRS